MPYTTPLREVPPFPSFSGQVANPDGRPSKEWLTWLRDLEDWAEKVQAALVEVEPP